jgi:hypothetical protein
MICLPPREQVHVGGALWWVLEAFGPSVSMNRCPVWAETVYDLLTGMKKVGLSTTKQSWVANADLVKHGIPITIIFIQST